MASNLDQTFAALADPTRLAIIRLLRKGPLRSSELAEALDLTRPNMSRHLQVLRRSELVTVVAEDALDADARQRTYQLQAKRFAELRTWLEEVEGFWSEQLDAFKAHAERKPGKRR